MVRLLPAALVLFVMSDAIAADGGTAAAIAVAEVRARGVLGELGLPLGRLRIRAQRDRGETRSGEGSGVRAIDASRLSAAFPITRAVASRPVIFSTAGSRETRRAA
jgi:hypothetical protein